MTPRIRGPRTLLSLDRGWRMPTDSAEILPERRLPLLVNAKGSGPTMLYSELDDDTRARFDAQMAAYVAAVELTRASGAARFAYAGARQFGHDIAPTAAIGELTEEWKAARDALARETRKWKGRRAAQSAQHGASTEGGRGSVISKECRETVDARRGQFNETIDLMLQEYAETRGRLGPDDTVMLLLFTAEHRLTDCSAETLADLLVTALARIDRTRQLAEETIAEISAAGGLDRPGGSSGIAVLGFVLDALGVGE